MKKTKSIFALLLIVTLLLGVSVSAYAMVFSDTANHWAKDPVDRWSGYGVIQGYENLFRPNDSITRGEVAVILDRVMAYWEKAENAFSDLDTNFYTDAILRTNAAGVMQGDGDNIYPKDPISREEAAVMIGRALGVKESTTASTFSDHSAVSSWAAGFISAMQQKGYIQGDGENTQFRPKDNITRAELVKMLDNIVKGFYYEAGTYTGDVAGTVVVNCGDVTLEDMVIEGDLILAEGVNKGKITLDNVTVKGEIINRGEADIVEESSSSSGGGASLGGGSSTRSLKVEDVDAILRNVLRVTMPQQDGLTFSFGRDGELVEIEPLSYSEEDGAYLFRTDDLTPRVDYTLQISKKGFKTYTNNNIQFYLPPSVSIQQSTWTHDDSANGQALNDFMAQLWDEGVLEVVNIADTDISQILPGYEFPILYIDKGKFNAIDYPEGIGLDDAHWSIPVTLTFNPNVLPAADANLTTGQGWDDVYQYQFWIGLKDQTVGSTTLVEIPMADGSTTVFVIIVGSTQDVEVAQPQWTATTDNAAAVNALMEQLWQEDRSVFFYDDYDSILEIYTDYVPSDLGEKLSAWWGDTGSLSVPVKVILPNGTEPAAEAPLVKDPNWDNSYLFWLGLADQTPGTTTTIEIPLADGSFCAFQIKVYDKDDVYTSVVPSQPVWSAETPNAAAMNELMSALWAEDAGIFTVSSADDEYPNDLIVDLDKLTPAMILQIQTYYDNTGRLGLPIALSFPAGKTPAAAAPVTKDPNWNDAYIYWLNVGELPNNDYVEVEIPMTDGSVEYFWCNIDGVENLYQALTAQQAVATGFSNNAEINALMADLWDSSVFQFTGGESWVTKGGTLTIDLAKITDDMANKVAAWWDAEHMSVPVALTFPAGAPLTTEGAIGDGDKVAKVEAWNDDFLFWIGLKDQTADSETTYRIHLDNGTTAVLNIAVIDSGAEPVEPIDAILSQPTWTGASANADETNALIEKLWTPIEEDGYGIFSFEEDSYTLTIDLANRDEAVAAINAIFHTNGSIPVQLDLPADAIPLEIAKDLNWGEAYLYWIGLNDQTAGDEGTVSLPLTNDNEANFEIIVIDSSAVQN